MTDYFALLDCPRRPWFDVDSIKQRFHERSTEVHPDLASRSTTEDKALMQRRFTEVNAAYECLRESKSRVRHLLELELGQVPRNVRTIPDEMTDWFMEIGSVCREVDSFLAKKEMQDSPMLRAALMGEGMALNEQVSELHTRLQAELARVDLVLRSLCQAWETVDHQTEGRVEKLPLVKLEALGQQLSFWSKWSNQLAERSSRLMF